MRIALRTLRRGSRRPAVEGHRDDEVAEALLVGGVDRAAVERRRAVRCRGEGLVAGRVVDDADGRDAVDDQADRHAEERDAVGVVHGAVERVDDPDPAAARGRRLARDRPMLAGLLGEDRVARVARPDRVEDERLGQVVRLGHHVAGALVVDLLEPLVAVHQDLAGANGQAQRERELVRVGGRGRGGGRGAGHGALHSTARSRTLVPSSVTVLVNVSVCRARSAG